MAQHTSRQRQHLNNCAPYQSRSRFKESEEVEASNHGIQQRQTVLRMPKIDMFAAKELDHQAAMALYLSASPFGLYHQPAMERFLKSLNPAYKVPDRRRFAGALLDEAYTQVKAKVSRHFQQATHLNIIIDESSNITMERIANISVHTSNGAFYHASDNIHANRSTAQMTKAWLWEKLVELTDNNLLRINSIATDTCATMLAVWDLMAQEKCFQHTLFVPCDAHGLQLIIKDLLERTTILKSTHSQAQSIAHAFRAAPLQYARLREHQQIKYKRHYALILAVITRWGTQYRLIDSILRSKDALRAYALEPIRLPGDLKENAMTAIKDASFWSNMDLLKDIIEPIDTQIRMAESTKAHLGTVMKRWNAVEDVLKAHTSQLPELEEFRTNQFQTRFARQVLDIHWVAHYLVPENVSLTITPDGVQSIIRFFAKQPNYNKDQPLLADFLSFRGKEGIFSPTAPCWTQSEHPLRFWQLQAMFSPGLGTLAVRLFSTPANTVPSERAFSAQNLIHDRKRNRLSAEKTNKLVYIHMNQRLLDNLEKQQTMTELLHNTDEIAMEDEYLPLSIPNTLDTSEVIDMDMAVRQNHKRKPSAAISSIATPPSLRTELTDDLATLL
jgi:hypothetical protein